MVVERVPILEPGGPNLLLHLSLVIGWRNQRAGLFNLHQHDTADGAYGSPLPIKREPLLKNGSLLVNGRRTLEAISLAAHWINHIDLDNGMMADIGDRIWRTDIRENDVFTIPDGGCPLGGKVRSTIFADRGHKA